VVTQRRAGTEHGEQPHRRPLVVGHLLQQPLPVVDGVGQGDQRSEGLVGVGTAPDERDDRSGHLAEPPEESGCAIGVEETQTHQLALGDATLLCHPANLSSAPDPPDVIRSGGYGNQFV
jgi:hypothetical protein